MREAKNRQQLSSLALLGQEFWRYPMANPKPPESSGTNSNTSSLGSFHTTHETQHEETTITATKDKTIILNLIPISTQDTTTLKSSINPGTFAIQPRLPRPTPPNTLNLKRFNEPLLEPTKERVENIISPDKLCQQLVSPNLVQSVRCRSPVVHNVENNVLIPTESTKTFEANFHRNQTNLNDLTNASSPNTLSEVRNIVFDHNEAIANIKTPPPPPPRWAKPGLAQNNVTVTSTTTVITLNVNQTESFAHINSDKSLSMLSPQSITSSKSLCSNLSRSTMSPGTPTSKLIASNNGGKTPNLLSPATPSGTSKSRRRRDREARKNSQHYQESDILESYCRSSPADKVSDYEDIWNTTDRSNSSWSPLQQNGAASPAPSNENKIIRDTFADRVVLLRNDRSSRSREKLSYMEIASPEFSSFKPIVEGSLKSPRGSNSPEEIIMAKRPDLLSRVCSANSLNSPNNVIITPVKNKLAMMFTKSESNSPLTPESKQSSPFYAEPADAIGLNGALVARRRHKNTGIASKYRHSEPGWFQMPGNCHVSQINPADWAEGDETEDKIPLISSSVDNLSKRLGAKEVKKIYPRAKPVQPPKVKSKVTDASWTVDSSWEFIGNEGDEEKVENDDKSKSDSEKRKSKKESGSEEGSEDTKSEVREEEHNEFDDRSEFSSDILARGFPKDAEHDGGNSLTVQSIIFQR